MMGCFVFSVLLVFISVISCLCYQQNANIIFVLTDDQDVKLGGQIPMTKTAQLIGGQGITFSNTYVSSPLCCPSRSSILTGKYVHNHKAVNNSISGNCSSHYWQQTQEPTAFPAYLKSQGYNTFFAGKYLNQYGDAKVGGVKHVPPGWDSWIGLVGNSKYYNYKLSVDGKEESHGQSYSTDYLPDLINRHALKFLEKQKVGRQFFMMLSTPACHSPFTPAPQYSSNFTNNTSPRNGSYNKPGKEKHWLIRKAINPMPQDTVSTIDDIFRNRWRTLLSVDDMVENVVSLLTKKGFLNNTYIFFSSDNGYHLGQFSMPYDKRQLYEFDVRVPLMVRGPGIKAGQTLNDTVQSIDLAPTFLELSGHLVPKDMDGKSLLPLLRPTPNRTGPFRETALIEHQGEMSYNVSGCPQYTDQWMANCPTNAHCVCEDSWNNTYGCVVDTSSTTTYKYCEFQDRENFVEVYNLKKDPEEMSNLVKSLNPKLLRAFHKKLVAMSMCFGAQCYNSTQTVKTVPMS